MSAPAREHTASDAGDAVLVANGIVKTYGVTQALKGVNFEVRAGKVTVLFGENGAGKSTLMKILAGIEQPTAGHLVLDGEPVHLRSSSDALVKGIAIIHQELSLFPNLSVRDNIFVGRELLTAAGSVDYRAEDRATRALLDRLELDVATSTPVEKLRLGQQQLIEIARALEANARILIMDEPTSALSASEVEILFRVIRDLTARGVAIIYISHHLEEAIEISDHAVVFRDGELVATADARQIDLPWVVSKMVGREAGYDFRDEPRAYGEVVLDIDDVVVASPDGGGKLAVDGVSIQVRAGEIVCLYGLMGAGRTELMEALSGRDQLASGDVRLNGRSIRGLGVRQRIAAGLGLVPEDRQRDGLVQLLSVGRNLSLSSLERISRNFWLTRGGERELVTEKIRQVRVKTYSPDAPITSLSGGNQQKVVIGRVLMTRPDVILLDEPTRGIDVGAKGEIFALLFEQARQGLGVLYVTSEVGEALTASHRIIVMRKGRIVREFDPRTASREEVMAASGEAVDDSDQTEGNPS
jgi:erythritol transport system ATP-binding protein